MLKIPVEKRRAAETRKRPFARRQALLAGFAVTAPLLCLVGLGAADVAPVPLVVSLSSISSILAGGLVWSVWRDAARLDDLAARLAAEVGVEARRAGPSALIEAAFAASEMRMAAMMRNGDPARRDDPETGMPNRQTVMRRGRDEITRARRNQQPLVVGLLSLDLGPEPSTPTEAAVQERALRLVAEIAMQGLRAYDIVGRWERDVFIAIIPQAEVENGVVALERVRTMTLSTRGIRLAEPLPEMHAGVAVLQPDDATIAEVAARAQRALDRARSGTGAAVQAAPGPRHRPVHLTSV